MSFRVQHNGEFYDCIHEWPKECMIQISEPEISCLKDKMVVSKKPTSERYMFSVFHPVSENIEMPDSFMFGKWQRPRMWVVGYGETLGQSEMSAASRLVDISNCAHKFQRCDDGMGGDARCSKCGIMIPELMLNKDIHFSKYKAIEYHGDEKLFGGTTVVSHLMSTTQEVAYDYGLKESEKVDLICAGWLHHTDGTIFSNDAVERTLKYFFLDPQETHESLVLSYYDLVDTIKILLGCKDAELLARTLKRGKEMLPHFENRGMPHAFFLTTYNLMAEQNLTLISNNLI